jgi:hypothetical protein
MPIRTRWLEFGYLFIEKSFAVFSSLDQGQTADIPQTSIMMQNGRVPPYISNSDKRVGRLKEPDLYTKACEMFKKWRENSRKIGFTLL